jgi:hypothetical protein
MAYHRMEGTRPSLRVAMDEDDDPLPAWDEYEGGGGAGAPPIRRPPGNSDGP